VDGIGDGNVTIISCPVTGGVLSNVTGPDAKTAGVTDGRTIDDGSNSRDSVPSSGPALASGAGVSDFVCGDFADVSDDEDWLRSAETCGCVAGVPCGLDWRCNLPSKIRLLDGGATLEAAAGVGRGPAASDGRRDPVTIGGGSVSIREAPAAVADGGVANVVPGLTATFACAGGVGDLAGAWGCGRRAQCGRAATWG